MVLSFPRSPTAGGSRFLDPTISSTRGRWEAVGRGMLYDYFGVGPGTAGNGAEVREECYAEG